MKKIDEIHLVLRCLPSFLLEMIFESKLEGRIFQQYRTNILCN